MFFNSVTLPSHDLTIPLYHSELVGSGWPWKGGITLEGVSGHLSVTP